MMLNYSEFLQNPVIVTIAITVIVIVMLSVTVLIVLLVRQRRCLEKVQSISDGLSHLQDSFVRTNLNLESVAERLKALEYQNTEFLQNYEHSKVELARLAETMGGENQLTKAIDLARGGASAEEIALATGLGEDESNVIVKSHGATRR